MSIEFLLSELNSRQCQAATMDDQHALILAGAGSGKTKTIVGRAAYLISEGVPAQSIQILTFTRRAAAEIVSRVKSHLGNQADGLRACTFHTWCSSLIHSAPAIFGQERFSTISPDDQIQLFKALRGQTKRDEANILPDAKELRDMYSYARNTGQSLTKTLRTNYPEHLEIKDQIVPIMKGYERKKQECHYLDFDDMLVLVAQQLNDSPKFRRWVGKQFQHLLVDEMQDTNPLQWTLLNPLKDSCYLFCVGDDAQSIYRFRGADFRNVHSFQERVPDSVVLKLNKNYRSTQEILDVPNWLLAQSPLPYGKKLVAARGSGVRPQLHTFSNEWAESSWITKDILRRRDDGDSWRDHMILTRTSYSAREVESSLIAADIPYRFIGGKKLLESAHVSDLLSLLRIIGNPRDELAIMRYLTLFHGVGDAIANRAKEQFIKAANLKSAIKSLQAEKKVPSVAAAALLEVEQHRNNVAKAISIAANQLDSVLANKYRKQDWPNRKRDFELLVKLAEKHDSILGFIEEYLLDPIHISKVKRNENDDVVTLITIHSGKGTECKTCYVINVSPGAFPSTKSVGDPDQVEEERRVLYVGLTRAMDHLLVTRQSNATWAMSESQKKAATATYFLNNLPKGLFDEVAHNEAPKSVTPYGGNNQKFSLRGIDLD